MANEQQKQDQQKQDQQKQDQQPAAQQPADHPAQADVDGLKGKKPEELTPEELRLMADTMPGEGPGD